MGAGAEHSSPLRSPRGRIFKSAAISADDDGGCDGVAGVGAEKEMS